MCIPVPLVAGSAIRLYAGYYYFFFYYPSPSRPIHLSNVQCSGSESRLIDCPHSSGGNGSDAELTCYYGKFIYSKTRFSHLAINSLLSKHTLGMHGDLD